MNDYISTAERIEKVDICDEVERSDMNKVIDYFKTFSLN
jgi:hypothetical protein